MRNKRESLGELKFDNGSFFIVEELVERLVEFTKDNTNVYVDLYSSERGVEFDFYYYRPETPEEVAYRTKLEETRQLILAKAKLGREAYTEAQEREQYERLKKKYE